MKTPIKKTAVLLGCIALSLSCTHPDPTGYVVTMMGTGGAGGIVPNAAVPFGMVQLAPDTDAGGTGYFYGRNSLMGFSHTHKSGSGGGSDFQDILFLPVTGDAWDAPDTLQNQYRTPFSHEDELSSPGYYSVLLPEFGIRAHLPLITVVHPEVMTDLMKTMLSHYDHCGQLPIWTLAGQETCCMEGYPAAPVVSDAYSKGIRGFDAEKMLDALDVSASRDTFGFFCRAYRGATNYRKYHYVPNDLEISSVSKTLEYSYDDWCISKFAGMLGRQDLEKAYLERSGWYRNVFDPGRMLMRGRDSKGDWREPFDPFYSNHNRSDDDFMEGTAWHWTFHVPHDPEGLMELLGGRQAFAEKLDSLFFVLGPEIHGPNPSGDMTGMIGHYAQGNEPGHHTIYFYNLAGQPWKTQKLVTEVMHTLYNTTPEGICGNDDTGQMSAWYVWNAMGLYPMTHGDAEYMIGSPQHERLVFHHANGTLTVEAPGVSPENCYIRRITLNGKPLEGYKVRHEALFEGDAHLHFEMSSTPRED